MRWKEHREMAISVLGLGAAFAILFFGNSQLSFIVSAAFLPALVASTLLAAVSFVPHETSHRVSARAINAYAEYEMWTPGVIIAVLSSFLGVVFAAPGGIAMATQPGERYGRWEPDLHIDQIGLVALVGPLTNVMLAVLFAFFADVTAITVQGQDLLTLGSRMNAYIAVFNLLPFYPMDGYKVMRWDVRIWLGAITLAALLFLL